MEPRVAVILELIWNMAADELFRRLSSIVSVSSFCEEYLQTAIKDSFVFIHISQHSLVVFVIGFKFQLGLSYLDVFVKVLALRVIID